MSNESENTNKQTYSAALAPFVVEFTLALLLNLQGKTFTRRTKESIHTDLVPNISEHVIEAQMKEKPLLNKRTTNNTIIPRQQHKTTTMIQEMKPSILQPKNNKTQMNNNHNPEEAWNNITRLLNDNSITHIECQGPNKKLTITRQGRKQGTNISLNEKEIKNILKHIAEQAHIPLLEGTFNAALETYTINAITSEMIGSKFIIKKQTPYSILE